MDYGASGRAVLFSSITAGGMAHPGVTPPPAAPHTRARRDEARPGSEWRIRTAGVPGPAAAFDCLFSFFFVGAGSAGGARESGPVDHPDAAGELYWGGVAGTQWWISPKHNMAGVMMAQRQMAFVHPFSFEFKRLAYETVKQGAEVVA